MINDLLSEENYFKHLDYMAKQIKRIENPNFNQPLTAELIGKLIKARHTQSALRLEDAAALCGVAKQTLMKMSGDNQALDVYLGTQLIAQINGVLNEKEELGFGDGILCSTHLLKD